MQRTSFTLEFLFKASPAILYKFLTTPSCLTRWFCDAVDITGSTYTFSWSGSEEVAELVEDIEEERLKFRWMDSELEDNFLEFKIYKSSVTGETVLEVSASADEDEVEDEQRLWESQIKTLRQETGG
jgi:uncharacterized protein YndB with AHSA1/START domain